jgi:hypothetical protein
MTSHILAVLAAWCALGQLAVIGSGVLRLGPRRRPAEAVARITRP